MARALTQQTWQSKGEEETLEIRKTKGRAHGEVMILSDLHN